MPIYEDNSRSIGNTPLVKLHKLAKGLKTENVYAKIEGRNPAYSVKCRIGAAMVWDAEWLKPVRIRICEELYPSEGELRRV